MWCAGLVLLGLVACAAGQVNPYADCCDSYCYRDDDNPHIYMGTKTAYEFVYGKSSNQHIVPTCTPMTFWAFIRHGSRLPTMEKVHELEKLQKLKEDIIKNYNERKSYPDTGRLCDKDLDLLKRWTWNSSLASSVAESSSQQGKEDLTYLARRYQTRYARLLRVPYSNQHYLFRYAAADKTKDSFDAFAAGNFGPDAYKAFASHMGNNSVLEAYKTCAAWKREVYDNPDTLTEYNKFIESEIYRKLIAHVSRRLGYKYTLNETLIKSMYDMCRLEKSWYVTRPSAWCAAFTREHLKLLEYAEDLKHYYLYGYGSQMNQQMGCLPVKDMIDRFERVVMGYQSDPKVVAYFTIAPQLELFLTALGISKDSFPLLSTNMKMQQKRQWKTSEMAPFAANLVAVLYQCNQDERYRVMLFLNENLVNYPGCSVGLCSWNYLKDQLQSTVNNCDLEFCDRAAAPTTHLAYPLLLLSFSLIFVSRF